MEKKIELRKVPCGENFKVFGEEFTVLDHADGGVLSLRAAIWKDAPFDTGAKNNLSDASILRVLGEYAKLLIDGGANDDAFLPLHIDLKATDGTRAYGYCDTDVGLLTLEQYGKYKDIIPFADNWWWLASPVWTRWLRSPFTFNSTRAWLVYSDGDASSNNCTDSCSVRPALNFNPCLLVSLTCDEQKDDDDLAAKKDAWSAYIDYVNDWAEYHSGIDHYGDTPTCFDQWLDEEYEPDAEQ